MEETEVNAIVDQLLHIDGHQRKQAIRFLKQLRASDNQAARDIEKAASKLFFRENNPIARTHRSLLHFFSSSPSREARNHVAEYLGQNYRNDFFQLFKDLTWGNFDKRTEFPDDFLDFVNDDLVKQLITAIETKPDLEVPQSIIDQISARLSAYHVSGLDTFQLQNNLNWLDLTVEPTYSSPYYWLAFYKSFENEIEKSIAITSAYETLKETPHLATYFENLPTTDIPPDVRQDLLRTAKKANSQAAFAIVAIANRESQSNPNLTYDQLTAVQQRALAYRFYGQKVGVPSEIRTAACKATSSLVNIVRNPFAKNSNLAQTALGRT